MPLVYTGREEADIRTGSARDRARKIDPRFTEGELVRVARGRHQAEAELIQGLLLEEGVPSIARRSAGFDVPDFLAAGPRDVLVPASGFEAAREVLLDTDLAAPEPPPDAPVVGRALRLTAAVAGGGALAAFLAWALLELASG
jgi:hypothetical protein